MENRCKNDWSLLPDSPKSASIIKYFYFSFFGSEKVIDDHFDPTFGGVIGLTFWARTHQRGARGNGSILPKNASIIKYFQFLFFGSGKVLYDHFDPTFGGVIGVTFWARKPLTLTFWFWGLIFAPVFQIQL